MGWVEKSRAMVVCWHIKADKQNIIRSGAVHMCVRMCVYVSMCMYIYDCMCVCMHVYVCICAYVCVCMYVYMYVCMYVSVCGVDLLYCCLVESKPSLYSHSSAALIMFFNFSLSAPMSISYQIYHITECYDVSIISYYRVL